jgi:tetratricopeptide (TPR) repeat protein
MHPGKDELNAAEMKNNESVALLQAGKAKEALQATDGTEEVFQKAGDIKRQGIAVSNRAAALEGLKKWKEALAEYDRAASFSRRRVKAICTPSSARQRRTST